MDTFDDLDARLTASLTGTLTATTAAMTVPPGQAAAAVRRARRIRFRRRRMGVLATVAVLTTATVGVIQLSTGHDRASFTVLGGDPGSTDPTTATSLIDTPPDQATPPPSPSPASSVAAVVETPDAGAPAGDLQATIVPSPLTWQTVQPNRKIPFMTTIRSDPTAGTLYAVSTQPTTVNDGGQNRENGVIPVAELVRSTDGVTWETLGELGQGYSGRRVAAYDGRLYEVSTVPSAAPIVGQYTADAVIRTSADGLTWQRSDLPGIDFDALRQRLQNVDSAPLALAAGPKGTIVAAEVRAHLDQSKLRAAVGETAGDIDRFGWEQTADGVQVFSSPCPDGWELVVPQLSPGDPPDTLMDSGTCSSPSGESQPAPPGLWHGPGRLWTWVELGVADADIPLYQGRPRFALSTDGTTFHEVTIPLAAAPDYPTVKLWADADGFVAATLPFDLYSDDGHERPRTAQVFASTDGSTWSEVGALTDTYELFEVSRVDGAIRAVRSTVSDSIVISTIVDGTTTNATASNVVGSSLGQPGSSYAEVVSTNGSHVVLVVNWSPLPAESRQRVEHDQFALEVDRLTGEMAIFDAAGIKVGGTDGRARPSGRIRARIDGGFAVVDDQGAVLDVFSSDEVNLAWQAVSPMTSRRFFVYSADLGSSWSVTSVDEVSGNSNAYVGQMTVLADGGVLTQLLVGDGEGDDGRQTLRAYFT